MFYFQLFDMKKFQSNVNRELRRAYPDRRRLECQCLSSIAFVKSESELLECPIWVLIINIVAMDMLKSKLPPGEYHSFIITRNTATEQKLITNKNILIGMSSSMSMEKRRKRYVLVSYLKI